MEFDDVQNVFGDLLLEVRYGLVLAYYRRLVLSPEGGQVISPVSEIGGDG